MTKDTRYDEKEDSNHSESGISRRVFINRSLATAGGAVLLSNAHSWPAWAGFTTKDIEERLEATAADGSVEIKVIQGDGPFFTAAVEYTGPGLPGEKAIRLEMDPPESGRFLASHVLKRLYGAYDPYWTEPQWGTGLANLHGKTTFVLFESDGRWGAMIPLVGGGMQSRLAGSGGKVVAVAESLSPGFTPKLVPMLAIGFGEDPYKLVRDLYSFSLATMKELSPGTALGRPRWEKPYPEIYRYFGWCSWNAYYRDINEEKLTSSTREFKDKGLPLRFVLIDDGWMQIEKTKAVWNNGRSQSLSALEADPVKFPGGLDQTISAIKEDLDVSWVGVWMTFQGYWNGIKLDSKIGRDLPGALMPVTDEVGIPDPKGGGKLFWDAWFDYLQGEGIDFVKVDNQSTTGNYVLGKMPVNEVMSGSIRNMETAAMSHFDVNVLDCMSLNVDAIYMWNQTNLARSSIDTWPRQKFDPRHHATETVTNALWLSNLAWPDFDMWQTHLDHADYHAIGRAISGGPMYVADEPGRLNPELIWPLIFMDGEVIRADEPGLPARQSLLSNPYYGLTPLVAFARSGKGGALAVWNVDNLLRPVKGEMSPGEVEGIEGERFAVYDYSGQGLQVLRRDEKFRVDLPRWSARIYTVVPVSKGFAAIGLADKYLAAATVKAATVSEGTAKVTLREAGPFLAYVEKKPTRVNTAGSGLAADKWAWEAGIRFSIRNDSNAKRSSSAVL